MIKLFSYLLSVPKSIYFNFRLLSFKQACKLPIFVHFSTKFTNLGGRALVREPKFLCVKIGFPGTSIHCHEKSVLDIRGQIEFNGSAFLGTGIKLSVIGEMNCGKSFCITGPTSIICHDKIEFGSNVLISWGGLIMDTDFHVVYQNGSKKRTHAPIKIGDNVWLGEGVTVTKGAVISNDSIVGIKSVVARKHLESNVTLAGTPAKIIFRDIRWER